MNKKQKKAKLKHMRKTRKAKAKRKASIALKKPAKAS